MARSMPTPPDAAPLVAALRAAVGPRTAHRRAADGATGAAFAATTAARRPWWGQRRCSSCGGRWKPASRTMPPSSCRPQTPALPMARHPMATDYDRPVVIVSTLKLDAHSAARWRHAGGQLPGGTLYRLEQLLKPLGRQPHSVIGSSCIGASIVGGVCNNSGGALVRRGPAYTELSLFAQIGRDGRLQPRQPSRHPARRDAGGNPDAAAGRRLHAG